MLPTTEIEGEMKGQQMWWDIYPDREKKKMIFFLFKKEVKRATLCDDKSSLHWKDASEWVSWTSKKLKKATKTRIKFEGNFKIL